jgi:hypothetical protein
MPTKNHVKTLNGRPTALFALDLSQVDGEGAAKTGVMGKLKLAYKNLNLILAGMYTGVTCYGVPHEEQSYKSDDQEEKSTD